MNETIDNSHILRSFFQDMVLLSNEEGFFRFAYQSRSHWMLICLIGSESSQGICFEDICSKVDRKLVSRSTIQSILENGCSLGFLHKEPLEEDKRRQLYKLNSETLLNLDSWVARQKRIFAPK